jgi:large subunit ribosomal protein L7/L12
VEGINYSEKTNDLLKTFESMTLIELKEFKEAFEAKFDVKAAAPMAGFVAAAPGAGAAVAAEEKPTTVSLVIKAAGDKKIQVIKVVREVTSLGLKEAKDLVDAAPKAVKEGMTPEEAQKLKEKFEAAGAEMEIK